MTIPDLILAIKKLAKSERTTAALIEAVSNPSPVSVIVETYDDLRSRTADLDENEIEILRHCCRMIRTNHWHGRTMEAIEVEGALPPPPAPAMTAIPPTAQLDEA